MFKLFSSWFRLFCCPFSAPLSLQKENAATLRFKFSVRCVRDWVLLLLKRIWCKVLFQQNSGVYVEYMQWSIWRENDSNSNQTWHPLKKKITRGIFLPLAVGSRRKSWSFSHWLSVTSLWEWCCKNTFQFLLAAKWLWLCIFWENLSWDLIRD